MESQPDSLPTFIRLKLNCVGCLMAKFCTLQDVSNTYGIPIHSLIEELENPKQNPVLKERK